MSFSDVPLRYRLAAFWQWGWVGALLFVGVLLTYFPMGILVALTAKVQAVHPQGKPLAARHDARYIAEGASGWWEYANSAWAWLRPWCNYEDGLYGEPSGKTSARCKGRERTRWNVYLWLCRNPFNWAKRTSSLFACLINDCDLDWWGPHMGITDKAPVVEGWYFCRATHRTTGRVYYGYRRVRLNEDGTVYQMTLGYKIKPEHASQVQDSDDLDKAFTLRVQFSSKAD